MNIIKKFEFKINENIDNSFYNKNLDIEGCKWIVSIYKSFSDEQFYIDLYNENIGLYVVQGYKLTPNLYINSEKEYVNEILPHNFILQVTGDDYKFYNLDIDSGNINNLKFVYSIVEGGIYE